MSVGLSEFSEEKMKTYREGNKKKNYNKTY